MVGWGCWGVVDTRSRVPGRSGLDGSGGKQWWQVGCRVYLKQFGFWTCWVREVVEASCVCWHVLEIRVEGSTS